MLASSQGFATLTEADTMSRKSLSPNDKGMQKMMSKISALLLGFIFASHVAYAMELENLDVSLRDRETLEKALHAMSKGAPKIKIIVFGNDENKNDSNVIIKKFLKISLDDYVPSNDSIAYKKYSQNLLVLANKISIDILDIKVPFVSMKPRKTK